MKAMILAAGKGTRLKPITNSRPKALVEVNGLPLLQLLIKRLVSFGFDEIIINVYHFADQIVSFLQHHNNFGIRIEISREGSLLDTGGGLKNASWFFNDDQPFLVHNVDVLTNLDYRKLMNFHRRSRSLASLAVRQRDTSRYLLFDTHNLLCGWQSKNTNETILVRQTNPLKPYSFMGIHFISPQIFSLFGQEEKFSIIRMYLQLAGQGQKISAFPADEYDWLDVGKPEQLVSASAFLSKLKN